MRPLLRIFRFCNPQRKHREPSLTVILVGAVLNKHGSRVIYLAGFIIISLICAFPFASI